jgi:phosphoglycolate phosphatase-like HAD superfamily hydrolase
MKTKYFITDVDGVIFDRMAAIRAAFAKTMRALGITEEAVLAYMRGSLGATFESQVKGILAQDGRMISDEDVRQARRRFWDEFDDKAIKLFPGVKDTLDSLKARGIAILASTGSRTGEVEDLFAKFGLPFDFIMGSDKILKGDQHIAAFVEHFSLPKNDFCRQAVLIGDGTVDMEIACRNKIFAIGITNSLPAPPLIAAGAKAIVADFAEVAKFLDQ